MSKKALKIGLGATGALLIVAGIIVTVVVLVDDGKKEEEVAPRGSISFEEFLNGAFRARTFNGTWRSATELQWTDSEGNIVAFDVTNNETTTIVDKDLLANLGSFRGFAPGDENLLLFSSGSTPVWRHSSLATYKVLNSESKTVTVIAPSGTPPADVNTTKLQLALWSPDGQALVYVHQNDLYYRSNAESTDGEVRLTTDGDHTTVYNGIPDWVFEEEVLGSSSATYLSQTGAKVAYARFDDTQVTSFTYTRYGNPLRVTEHLYPENVEIRYPKVGTVNPTFKLFVEDLEDLTGLPAPKEVIPPEEVTNEFGATYLFTAVSWSQSGIGPLRQDGLSVVWMDRDQSRSVVSHCAEAETTWTCQTVLRVDVDQGWLDLFVPPVHSASGNGDFLQIMQHDSAASDGLHYNHVALVTGSGAKRFLTEGNFAAIDVLGWNEDDSSVFVLGTRPDAPGERHVYVASSSASSNPAELNCLTCDSEMPSNGQPCAYSSVSLSPDFGRFVQTCNGPNVPEVVVRTLSLSPEHVITHVLEDNAALISRLENKTLPASQFGTYDLPDGFKARTIVKLPPGYDPDLKYPALVEVYAGPGSQEVTSRWSVGWQEYLSTNYGVVIISVDGRGSAYQSNEQMYSVSRHLGGFEMQDQIDITRTIVQEHTFIDPQRVGIWGWSYGGYSTLSVLSMDDGGVFSCGISVAPVTDWMLYDSIYTERYMGLFEDNAAGYNESSLLGRAEKLRGKNFMLNHGVADDNVHFQHAMLMARSLELADVAFVQNSFPEENHGIGGISRFHYNAMDSFWAQCFGHQIVRD